MDISIRIADLNAEIFKNLVNEHKKLMLEHSPPESSHALLIEALKDPSITVWSIFGDQELVGCGALRMLSTDHGEIKAMHTVKEKRNQGLGKLILTHIIAESRARNLKRLCLETGSQDGFRPARKLYEAHGFIHCLPFGSYKSDPNSIFMTLEL